MFNNLANYLLGTSSNQQEKASEVEHETTNLRLTSLSSDDEDWVLVDRDSEGNSELSSEESECEPILTEDVDPLATLLSRTSSTSSLLPRGDNTMEESWFLTPPPCFISSGPVHMETSPLENLLIEHPSMSVYQQPVLGQRRQNVRVSDGLTEEDRRLNAVIDAQNARENRISLREWNVMRVLETEGARTQHAQKVQIQKACQSLKRGYLERNNKAREVNCRNQRLRRGERSQGATRSHANNNRKC